MDLPHYLQRSNDPAEAEKELGIRFFDHEKNEETAPPEVLDQLNQEE